MKRIEQLLRPNINQVRFNYLAKDIRRNKLVVFFGAGLSLWRDYREWEYPFSWAHKRVKYYFKVLEKHYYHEGAVDDLETLGKLENIKELIAQGERYKAEKAFLEWGDTLDEAIQKLRQIYDETGRAIQCPFSCFNDACVRSFSVKGAPPDFTQEIPYGIPAIYYLPFLCSLIITTNIDTSFEEVCSKLSTGDWTKQAILPKDDIDFDHWNFPAQTILYIHGHINERDSLIMTKTEYDRMYPKMIAADGMHTGARMVLNKTVKDYSFLFLGAGLQSDRTVEIINHEAEQPDTKRNRNNKHFHFIPMAALKPGGNLVKTPQIKNCEPLIYDQDMYGEIPILLLHLIRETTQENDYCTWQKPNASEGVISEETATLISESLKRKDTYERISIKDDDPHNVVHHLFEHHSIAKHDSGLGWSICCITDADFSLDGYHKERGEPFSPLHNYPIGDTIYIVIRNNHLRGKDAKRIAQEISNWHRDAGFPAMRENDPLGDKEILPRIRVILFRSSYDELLDKIEELEDAVQGCRNQGKPIAPETMKILEKINADILSGNYEFMQKLYSMLLGLQAKENPRDIDTEGNTKVPTRTLKP